LDPVWKPFGEISERRPTVDRWSDTSGQSRVRGTADLKATQAYPPQFGVAVGRLFANLHCLGGRVSDGIPLHDLTHLVVGDTDLWEDARLDDVLRSLQAV
jgi:hypothetical protein